MSMQTQKRRRARAGYSLVEVTLALLVVAIGLTATFALFPEGLQATRAAVDDVEISMFAEYVFTSMDLAAGLRGAGWNINDVNLFRSSALSGDHPGQATLQTGQRRTFYWIPEHYDLGDGNFAAAKQANFWTSAFTYDLEIQNSTWKQLPANPNGLTKYAVLRVWPGDFGGSAPASAPRIFYREILPVR
jgi:type II secretory pathway pseudopilin PulG